jgi:transcriptional regulator with XRE-family HTH domain
MINYNKLTKAIENSGKTKTYLCQLLGRPPYYLRDVIKQKNNVPEEYLEILAHECGVTVNYLKDAEDDGVYIFYNKFLDMCAGKGVSAKQALSDMDIHPVRAQFWKSSNNVPTREQISKLSDYFGVSASYLLGEQEKPTLSGELSDARKQLDAALDDMSDEELLFLMSKIKAIKEMRE